MLRDAWFLIAYGDGVRRVWHWEDGNKTLHWEINKN